MFCPRCGAYTNDNFTYCMKCGFRLKDYDNTSHTEGTVQNKLIQNKPVQNVPKVSKAYKIVVTGISLIMLVVSVFAIVKAVPIIIQIIKDPARSQAADNGKISTNKITNAESFFTSLKLPDNYRCDMIMWLNGKTIINGKYWYKDGKSKLNAALGMADLGKLAGTKLDFSKSVTYFDGNAGVIYTCMPAMKVAIKSQVAAGSFFDQSTIKDMIDSNAKLKGTRKVTMDGIQCTIYDFEESGITSSIYVRNSLEDVIRIDADSPAGKLIIYFKNMDYGMVTSGDVLMTNNYKKFNSFEEFGNYIIKNATK